MMRSNTPSFLLRLTASTCSNLPHFAYSVIALTISEAATYRQIAAKQCKLMQIRRTLKYDTSDFHLPRQESECEPLGGLWRLKCGKSGQERQRVTTDLLLLRKEIVNNVKYSLGESSFRLLYCTDN